MHSDCDFNAVSFVLCGCYLLMLVGAMHHGWLLTTQPKRRAQKIFLFFVLLQCSGRSVYFFLWPLYGHGCEPSVSHHAAHWEDFLGTFPAAFFLSAFTVLTYTFARIFHTVLNNETSAHSSYFLLFQVVFTILNIVVYVGLVCSLARVMAEVVLVGMISVASFFVAAGFLAYGILLYRDVQRALDAARDAQDDTTGSSVPANPMLKIATVASVCMFCFVLRSVVLPVMNAKYDVGWLLPLLYFFFSEIVPLLLMLRIFDSKASSGTHAKHTLRPSGAGLADPTSVPYTRYGSLEENADSGNGEFSQNDRLRAFSDYSDGY